MLYGTAGQKSNITCACVTMLLINYLSNGMQKQHLCNIFLVGNLIFEKNCFNIFIPPFHQNAEDEPAGSF